MSDTILETYRQLGFEEVETDDGQIVLGIEFAPGGAYALLTDAEGLMPKSAAQEIIFACYTADDSFEWSASFKNSKVFTELWQKEETTEARITAIQRHREANQTF